MLEKKELVKIRCILRGQTEGNIRLAKKKKRNYNSSANG